MTTIVLALLVAVLLATGSYMVMRRGQIKLILGIALLAHGVNLMLFGSGVLLRGATPIFKDKENYSIELISRPFADPLPQALILTAIVISFGLTAFIVVLVSRRDALTGSDVVPGALSRYVNAQDPFFTASGEDITELLLSDASDDYDILQFELDELYDLNEPLPVDATDTTVESPAPEL
jgi:multicomponent Na+:H+ antiporter subunit C